jgi:hypothetical protein
MTDSDNHGDYISSQFESLLKKISTKKFKVSSFALNKFAGSSQWGLLTNFLSADSNLKMKALLSVSGNIQALSRIN